MGQKSRWTLPQVVHPTSYRKFVICVPNERFYIAAFQGLLIELTYSKNWQRDAGHTAAIVSRVWQSALENVLCDDCGETILMEESDYEMSICEQLRFHNGKLQGFCCGEWVDIAGQTGLPADGGDQPGDGTEQPGPGECVTYHAKMNASNQWYLPTIVNTGDTIEMTSALGAGNDGTLSPWHCPSGDTFFAGACIGGTAAPAGGDPLGSADHMELIMNVDGTFYRPLSGIFTVPGGVVNAPVYFQVNDSAISDNAGSYTFDVEVCNNEVAASYSHLFNFALGPLGWQVQGSAGSGWSGGAFRGASLMSSFENRIYINFAPGTSITAFSVQVNIDTTLGGGVDLTAYDDPNTGGTGTTVYNQGLANGSTADRNATVTAAITVGAGKECLMFDIIGEVTATYADIFSITLSGLGPDPF